MKPVSGLLLRSCLAAAVLALVGCTANRVSPDLTSTSSTPPFAQLRDQWAADLRAKRISESIARYSDDADFLQPDGTHIHGTAALQELFEKVTAQFDSDLHFTSRIAESSNGLAYDSGTYTETLTVRTTGQKIDSAGDYLTVYRRTPDGRWRISAQAWTSAMSQATR